MSSTAVAAACVTPRRVSLSSTASLYLLASVTLSFLAGAIAPTPLYALYQAQWGLDATAVTIVFGIYALAVLAALLTLGKLSDHLGRRPVLIAATAVQVLAMLLLATAEGLPDLLLARVVQGVGTGAALAAVGAGLLDMDRAKGTIANAVAPLLGTATGGIAAGLLVQFLPAPTHLVYLVFLVVFLLQGLGVWLMPEPGQRRAGAWSSLKPRIHVPAALRAPLLLAVPALVATWALAGLYGALGPTLLRGLLGSNAPLVGGLAVFALAGSGAIGVFLLRALEARTMLRVGALSLLAGMLVTELAIGLHSPVVFFIGTAIAGLGFGTGFQGGVRTVMPLAPPAERGGVLAMIFLVSYLAMGLPAVLAGYLASHGVGILTTAREYGAVVMLLAAMALLGTRTRVPARA
ncbi:MAG TPA: MFS transporter [Steroidobacteraceae bacterium]|nr:MFS transporter [Steroidobacteraceae bacterium]